MTKISAIDLLVFRIYISMMLLIADGREAVRMVVIYVLLYTSLVKSTSG